MRRIKITVAYDGTDFHGWQVQPGVPTVQETLQRIISRLEGAPVSVAGSGRTDAGVHALAQVAAFSLENPIPCENLRRAINRFLPPSVRITGVEEVDPGFHPRFDASAKTYEYRIFRPEVCDPFRFRYVHHHPYPLDAELMAATAPLLEGEHDFSAFATSDVRDSLGKSKVRRVFHSRLERSADCLVFQVRGSGFLKHMVRNIAGFLIETGKGNGGPGRLCELLVPGLRLKAGPTVPAKGLFLVSVEYSGNLDRGHDAALRH
ncbi:MAG: tRNA pseudouridine(38-40) synthase TruA [Acidobacteriota bacterium]|nr:tRNA pseudouridine(38-40) synthase TruA [Acidobacteriota bacterium]